MGNTTTLTFRVATPDDVPILHPLVESAYRGDESRLGWTTEADMLAGTRIDAAGLTAKITAPDAAVLLAFTSPEPDQKDALIACCEVARRAPGLCYFGMFAVSPRKQGGGIGRQVLAHAEEYCKSTWGAERMEMQVITGREALVQWYMRRGYQRTGETRPFPVEELEKQGGVALVKDLKFEIMEKDLGVALEGVAGSFVKGVVGKVSSGDSTPVVELGADAVADIVAPPPSEGR